MTNQPRKQLADRLRAWADRLDPQARVVPQPDLPFNITSHGGGGGGGFGRDHQTLGDVTHGHDGADAQVRQETLTDGTRIVTVEGGKGGQGGRGPGGRGGHGGSGSSTTINPLLYDPRGGGDGGPIDVERARRVFAEQGWPTHWPKTTEDQTE